MRNNYSNYLGVVTSAGASDEHPLSIHSASIGTRRKPRGLQVLLTLVFLFSLSIGQMWATDVTFGYGTSMSTSSGASGTKDSLATITHLTLTKEVGKAGTNKLSDSLSVYDSGNQACYGIADGTNKPTAQYSKGAYKWGKSRSSFSPNLYVGYKVEIEDGYKLNLSGLTSLMYVSSDFTYKVSVLDKDKKELFSTSQLTISNYNAKNSANAQIDSVLSDNDNLQNLKDSIFVRVYMYKGSTSKYFFISKLQLTGAVESTSGGGGGGDPVDPEFTYTPATYTIGDAALDLSKKLTSTNTTGAITFAVSTSDAGTTGANIANNKNFTATTAGTATITVSQAASTGYNAKSQDIEVTVVAPDPCHKYFWFAKAGDVPTGITNNENGFFGSTPSGSGSMTASITIDEVQYNITGRSSNTTPNISFTVPAEKSGKLYVVAQGSSDRSVVLKKGNNTIQTISWTTTKGDEFDPVGPGTYTITSTGGNVGWGMLAVKVCDAEFHTVSFDSNGGSAVASITNVLDGTKATKPTDPTKDNADFVKWVAKSTGADFSWDGVITSDTVLKAVWDEYPMLVLTPGEGTGTNDTTYHKATTSVSVPANPGFTKEGYSFNGWSASQVIAIIDGAFSMPETDLTLTATWVEDTYEAKIGSTNYTTVAAAIDAVADGQTITLLQACSYDAMWEIADKTVTLDLNGQNLTYTGTGRAVEVQEGGGLILMDGTATVAPTIDLTQEPLNENAVTYTSGKFELVDGIRVIDGGQLTINSGRYEATEGVALVKFTGSTVTVKNGVLISRDNGVIMGNGTNGQGGYTINIEGGILIGKIVTSGYASMVVYHPNVGTLNITGGTLVSTNGPAVVVRGGESDITGGTIIAQGSGSGKCGDASLVLEAVGVAYDFKSAYPGVSSIDAEITGGNIAGVAGAVEAVYANTTPTTAEEAAVAISGGTFNTAVAQSLCADGFVPEDNGDGSYGVQQAATTFDIEAYVVGAKLPTLQQVKDSLTAVGYTYSNIANIDRGHSDNYVYDGIKWSKDNNGWIAFTAPAGKLVVLKTGYMETNTAAQMSVNGTADTQTTIASPGSGESFKINYWYNANVAEYKLTINSKTAKGTCVVKAVTITDPYVVSFVNDGDAIADMTFYGDSLTLPTAADITGTTKAFNGWFLDSERTQAVPAVNGKFVPTASCTLYASQSQYSNVNTLASWKIDGVAAEVPANGILYIEEPYGKTPVISEAVATANVGLETPIATVAISNTPVHYQDATEDFWYVQASVTPEDPAAAVKYYQVRYTNALKQGVSLIKVVVPSGTHNDTEGTGYYGGTGDTKNEGSSLKLGTNCYAGVVLPAGKTFKTGDIINVHTSVVSTSGSSVIKIYEDKAAETLLYNTETIGGAEAGNNIFELPAAVNNKSSLYVVRTNDNSWNGSIDYMEVQRYMDPFIESFKIGEKVGDFSVKNAKNIIDVVVDWNADVTSLEPTIKAYANGGATLDKTGVQNFSDTVEYNVSSAYAEDGSTKYYVVVTKAAHYVAQIGETQYTDVTAAFAAVADGQTIELLDDCEYNTYWDLDGSALTGTKTVTLDLNGKNLTYTGSLRGVQVCNGAKLILMDGTAAGPVDAHPTIDLTTNPMARTAITYTSGTFDSKDGMCALAGSEIVINSGRYLATEGVILVKGNAATATVNDGVLICRDNSVISGNGTNSDDFRNYVMNIHGGILYGEIFSAGYASMVVYHPNVGTLNIDGGILVSTNGPCVVTRGGETNITGGTLVAIGSGSGKCGDASLVLPAVGIAADFMSAYPGVTSTNVAISGTVDVTGQAGAVEAIYAAAEPTAAEEDAIAVSGGTFNTELTPEVCAAGYIPSQADPVTGKYGVTPKDAMCLIKADITDNNTAEVVVGYGATKAVNLKKQSTPTTYEVPGDKTYTGYKFNTDDNGGSYFYVTLANGSFLAGDSVEVLVTATASAKMKVFSDKGATLVGQSAANMTTGKNPVVLTANADTLYLYRGTGNSGWNPQVAYIAVYRVADPMLQKFEFESLSVEGVINEAAKTVTVEVPYGTAVNALTPTLAYITNNNAQVTVSPEGAQNFTSPVVYTITDKDGSSTSYTVTVSIAEPSTDATLSALSYGGTAITLEDGVYDYTVNLAKGTTDVPALAATAHSAVAQTPVITNAAAFENYEATSTVVVTAQDGTTTQTYTVLFKVAHQITTLVDVTESTIWDWTTITARADGSEIDVPSGNKVYGPQVVTADGLILANYVLGGDNWDKIEGNNSAYAIRSSTDQFYQGETLHFHTTQPGLLIINARNNGKSMNLKLNDVTRDQLTSSFADYKYYVGAGDVTISFAPNEAQATAVRVKKITFVVESNYDRTVNPSFLGTLCWTNNAVLGGATLYEFAGKDGNNKLVFDEVEENRLEAGKPYIFMPENGNTQIKLYKTDSEAALTEDQDPVNHMYGTIEGKTLVPGQDDNMYYFSSNHIWAVKNFTVDIDVPAYYCYIDYPAVLADEPAGPAAPGRRRITMGTQGEQVATGIDAIEASEQPMKLMINGQIFILRGEKLFDATGRLVK